MTHPATAPAVSPFVRTWTNFAALRSRQVGRYLIKGRIRFCTFDQMLAWTIKWARQLPREVDAVIGMPRSGMLVANTLAAELQCPLSTPELFTAHQWWAHGRLEPARECSRVLLVDDSVNTGNQLRKTIASLRARFPRVQFESAVLLPHQYSQHLCDHHFKVVPTPRVFEWDIMHTKKYQPIAFDFDGVLCEDCDPRDDADEAAYCRFLERAKPLYIPQYEIDYIISNRLERYRSYCEEWLRRNGVRYRELILWDLPDKHLRCNRFARNKVRQILRIRPKFYIESDFAQSRRIALMTGVPVLCTDRKILFG